MVKAQENVNSTPDVQPPHDGGFFMHVIWELLMSLNRTDCVKTPNWRIAPSKFHNLRARESRNATLRVEVLK